MKHDEQIAVIAAERDGKEIEYQYRNTTRPIWLSKEQAHGRFNFDSYIYQIKPEPPKPREWWIYPMNDGVSCSIFSNPAAGFIHVREVLPSSGEEGK